MSTYTEDNVVSVTREICFQGAQPREIKEGFQEEVMHEYE